MGQIISESISGWGILLGADNQPNFWGKIIDYKGEMIIFEEFGQYPKRLVLECKSAADAQEGFDIMSKFFEQQRDMAEGA